MAVTALTDKQREAALAAINALTAHIDEHNGCTWEQVGPCVYCTDHDVRLYQGEVPDEKRTTPRCPRGEHDWDTDMGQGFYYLCRTCGTIEWTE